jgi:chromosome segregation ATPase
MVHNPVDERLNTAGIPDALNTSNAGVGMPEETLGDLEKKVERLGEGLDALRGEVRQQSTAVSKLDDLMATVQGIDSTVREALSSRETEVLFKKIDDVLISVKDVDAAVRASGESSEGVLAKKIDDLQRYVASLSTLEEKFEELSHAFSETQEIVGIIVRQLDDIERKYNKTLEEVTRIVEMAGKIGETGAKPERAKTSSKGEKKEAQSSQAVAPETTGKSESATPATIEDLMDGLLKLVRPQTEADRMARALEDTRDKLTALIPGHTPVLFQVGKLARELKSYPPTATLNENDIARLSKEIRGWVQKLKELTKGS